eukprot:CAMPEP_0179986718 /NCGR_PEP_ID=MMETSP0984-20121128/2389_1 /TAXON_ID=483367 /ORGANISM="non described non described, Strain CCMP 2436" /LENGTH=74 /DNA_ID=CAMNT_0021905537 /DNA_START=346 /DNA_END=570 /DNA_ORIENTATION=+
MEKEFLYEVLRVGYWAEMVAEARLHEAQPLEPGRLARERKHSVLERKARWMYCTLLIHESVRVEAEEDDRSPTE